MTKTIYDPRYLAITAILKEAREAKGLRMEAVARRIGHSKNWVSLVERNQLRLDVLQLARLCEVYELNLKDVLKGVAHPPPSDGRTSG